MQIHLAFLLYILYNLYKMYTNSALNTGPNEDSGLSRPLSMCECRTGDDHYVLYLGIHAVIIIATFCSCYRRWLNGVTMQSWTRIKFIHGLEWIGSDRR